MSLRERLLLGIGVVLGLVGLAVAFVPALAPDVRVVSAFVAAVALFALGAALAIGVARYRDDPRSPALPAPEGLAGTVPGDGIDRRIAALSTRDRRADDPPERHDALRERVERAARWMLSREGLDAKRAREQVADGTWTDDSHAAAFLSDAPATRPSFRERLRALRTAEPTVARRARHAIGALARRHHRHFSTVRSDDEGRTGIGTMGTEGIARTIWMARANHRSESDRCHPGRPGPTRPPATTASPFPRPARRSSAGRGGGGARAR